MLFGSHQSIKRFGIGDLVYDEYYGTGLVVDFDERFDEMQVNFKEGCEWLTTHSVRSLTLVSRAEDRKKALDNPLTT